MKKIATMFALLLMLAFPVHAGPADVMENQSPTEPFQGEIDPELIARYPFFRFDGGATVQDVINTFSDPAKAADIRETAIEQGLSIREAAELIELGKEAQNTAEAVTIPKGSFFESIAGRYSNGQRFVARNVIIKKEDLPGYRFKLSNGRVVTILGPCLNLAIGVSASITVEDETLECWPPTQEVQVGNVARFEARKGGKDCKKKWVAKKGNPDKGEGVVFTTSYKKAGEYEVQLACGKTEKRVCEVVVTEPPPPAAPKIACDPQNENLAVNERGTVRTEGNVLCSWKAKGAKIHEVSPGLIQVSYRKPGTYNVCLECGDHGCVDICTKNVHALAKPPKHDDGVGRGFPIIVIPIVGGAGALVAILAGRGDDSTPPPEPPCDPTKEKCTDGPRPTTSRAMVVGALAPNIERRTGPSVTIGNGVRFSIPIARW